MNKVVYFDLDGVLADFVGGSIRAHGVADNPATTRWGDLENRLGPAAFWGPLGFDFWSGLDIHPDGFELLEHVERIVGMERIGILTSPCDTDGCTDGKRAWVLKHLPDYYRRLFIGKDKSIHAAPNKLLIDDHDLNVDWFLEAGGWGVLIPRPWNRRHALVHPNVHFNVPAVLREVRYLLEA